MKKPHLTAIVAMSPGRVIGREGALPWHLPEDLAFFKKTTLGHPIVMGRKTYESIGKPLPKRRNIILSRSADFSPPVEVIRTPHALFDLPDLGEQAFIIGGAEVFNAFKPCIDDWLVTHVSKAYPGDTFLSPFESDFPKTEVILKTDDFEIRRHFR